MSSPDATGSDNCPSSEDVVSQRLASEWGAALADVVSSVRHERTNRGAVALNAILLLRDERILVTARRKVEYWSQLIAISPDQFFPRAVDEKSQTIIAMCTISRNRS